MGSYSMCLYLYVYLMYMYSPLYHAAANIQGHVISGMLTKLVLKAQLHGSNLGTNFFENC